MKILIIEDEPDLRESIEEYFNEKGGVCETAANYQMALEKIDLYRYDCILLDINIPGGDGISLLGHLKKKGHSDGVLIISARNSLDDRLLGLELGADDYLVKPFYLSELKARVMAIIRRKSFNGNNLLVFDELSIDLMTREVKVSEQTVRLTRKEYALLLYFIANKDKVVSKIAIAEHLLGEGANVTDNFDFIYSHIKNIRRKLMDAGCKDHIQADYGVGYRFIG